MNAGKRMTKGERRGGKNNKISLKWGRMREQKNHLEEELNNEKKNAKKLAVPGTNAQFIL